MSQEEFHMVKDKILEHFKRNRDTGLIAKIVKLKKNANAHAILDDSIEKLDFDLFLRYWKITNIDSISFSHNTSLDELCDYVASNCKDFALPTSFNFSENSTRNIKISSIEPNLIFDLLASIEKQRLGKKSKFRVSLRTKHLGLFNSLSIMIAYLFFSAMIFLLVETIFILLLACMILMFFVGWLTLPHVRGDQIQSLIVHNCQTVEDVLRLHEDH